MHLANRLQWGSDMKNFVLFLAILSAGASFMFSAAAGEAVNGPNWASNVCSATRSLSFCQNPQQFVLIAAGLGAFWLLMAFVSAIRN
jgi:hypothetical protein